MSESSSHIGVEGVQALIERLKQLPRYAFMGHGIVTEAEAAEFDVAATWIKAADLEALLALRPQLVEKKEDLESRVEPPVVAQPRLDLPRSPQPDSSPHSEDYWAGYGAGLKDQTGAEVLQAVLDAIAGTLDPSSQIADHPNVKFAQMQRLKPRSPQSDNSRR